VNQKSAEGPDLVCRKFEHPASSSPQSGITFCFLTPGPLYTHPLFFHNPLCINEQSKRSHEICIFEAQRLECCNCHEKIEGEALFAFKQGGVVCERPECRESGSWEESFSRVQIQIIYEMIKKSYVELIDIKGVMNNMGELSKSIEHYLNFLTNSKLKTLPVMHEILKGESIEYLSLHN